MDLSSFTFDSVFWWKFFGFAAQGVFFSRFLVQWIYSEAKKESTIPVAFWYLSILGGLMLMTYAIHIKDPVFSIGQGLGIIIYLRNLALIRRHKI